MSKIISIVQSVEEINFILKKFKKRTFFLPLNLSPQLYCIDNKIDFYDPIKLVSEKFHENTIKHSKELIESLNYEDIKEDSHRKEFKAFVRFHFHTVAYLLELIKQLKSKKKIDEIVLSGWNCYYDQYSKNNYFISSILTELIDDIKITHIKKISYEDFSVKKQYKYHFETSSLEKNQEYILLTNLNYNFLRVFLFLRKNKQKIICPLLEDLNFIKKNIYKVLGVKFLKLVQVENQKIEKIKLPIIKFKYEKQDISKILNLRIEQEKFNILNLMNKSKAVDNLYRSNKIKYVFTNMTKGVFGYFVDAAKKFDIPSICIPHGTLSKNFNDYDVIYKKTISEAITSSKAKYNISQSNISKKFFEQNKKNFNDIIFTGNLIFSKKSKKIKKNKKILFAVTIKDLESIQLLGVEMYYEFIDNLFFLKDFIKKNNYDLLVKLHPTAYNEKKILNKIFKGLKFSTNKISNSFDNIFATLSFSSTVIEDSLNSKCPVILLDRWKRYKHCEAEEDIEIKNSAVYYVTNEKNLIKCLNTIKLSKEIDYSKYISSNDYKKNISNTFYKLF